MRFLRLRRFGLAFWLGLLALTASGVAQNQLSKDALVAALTDAGADQASGHFMPDGTFMPGPMPGPMPGHAGHAHAGHDHGDHASHDGGHTNRGHADCSVCGVVAAMAALTLSVSDVMSVPHARAVNIPWTIHLDVLGKRVRAPYLSRAPPSPIG